MLSVGVDPVLVEQMLVARQLACPDCGDALAPWAYTAKRYVRDQTGEVEGVRLRRSICCASSPEGCGRTHVLLPCSLLGRRLDDVGVIWSALLVRAQGRGWRTAVKAAGRSVSTVRGWLARLAERAGQIYQRFAELEQLVADGSGVDRLAPAGGAVPDALAQVGAGLAAVRRAWGGAVLALSPARLVAALSEGWLLGRRAFRPARLWINTSARL